jgi:acyl carrier protein
MGRTIMEKEEIKKFVEEEIEGEDYANDFFELDSLQKVELVMKCEQEYHILINDDDINSDFNNDMLVDLIYNKIIKVIC